MQNKNHDLAKPWTKTLEQCYGTAQTYIILELDINFVLKLSIVGVNTKVTQFN